MLSSQTKDEVIYSTMTRLKEQTLTPKSIVRMQISELERLLYPISFYKVNIWNWCSNPRGWYIVLGKIYRIHFINRIKPNICTRLQESFWISTMVIYRIMLRISSLCQESVQRWLTSACLRHGIRCLALELTFTSIESRIAWVGFSLPPRNQSRHAWP